MELRQLRYFLAVAQELHFGRAAERAHIEQSPLSRQIRQLEAELGVTLFLRNKHRVELTDAGRALLPEAQAILDATEHARRAVLRAEEGMIGRLTIAYTNLAMYSAFPRILAEYRRQYPQVEVELRDSVLTPAQIDALVERRVDIGVLRPPVQQKEIGLLTVAHERLIAALPAGHPLAECDRVAMRDLAQENFISFDRRLNSALQTLVLRMCQDAGFQPHIYQAVGDIPSMLALVSAGMGVALVPSLARNMGLKGIRFRPIQGGGPPLEVALAWNTEVGSRIRDGFIELARKVLAKQS
jgi:DNA-binding transcriptional LysR family regulator